VGGVTTLDSLLDLYAAPPELPWTGPVPIPDMESKPFWDGLRDHRLMILRCDECNSWVHTPLAACPRCLSMKLTPQQARGRGIVYSYTVSNREMARGVKPPYVAALVDLEEQPVRMLTRLVNIRVRDIRIGLPVSIVYFDVGNATIALFEPTGEAA
jgi:hypothetical protein